MKVSVKVKDGHAILRNGYIKNVQVLEYWINDDLDGGKSVMINAGNDRTGLFNGHITVDDNAMAKISRKFLDIHSPKEGDVKKDIDVCPCCNSNDITNIRIEFDTRFSRKNPRATKLDIEMTCNNCRLLWVECYHLVYGSMEVIE